MFVVNILIVLIIAAYGYFGWLRGFLAQAFELIGLVVSFLIALTTYRGVASWLGFLKLPQGLRGLLVFMLIWLSLELVFSLLWKQFKDRIPKDLQAKPANHLAGIVPGVLRGVVLLLIVLLIVASAPIPESTKSPVLGAQFSKPLLRLGTGLQQQFNNVFGSALKDTLAFRTVKTESDENLSLGFTTTKVKICAADEERMLVLVNGERAKVGLGDVRQDDRLREVGRDHSRDMLARGYFSHNTPEGLDPFDRMKAAGIQEGSDYTYAGENLAFAPTVDIAHTGLMNSPGHRANILNSHYDRLGIGCIDGGTHGKMFSQEFNG